ncbi:maltose O-acetyltransferase [Cyclobacterium lianum]|uniref:Maltose O-acetyltransferase n=1 Tax=Cyclobacterium lianum TaxID=388280 RepID=A0A1M7LLG1_9BACT|nr:sugar O-acetyltransferase [Cyclobacterium lianum]SHM78980.1 maltose O-acetyltransferase [Cyclobacterium lianum]
MKSEKEKMLAGELYLASDETLAKERTHARRLLKVLNDSFPDEHHKRKEILTELFGKIGNDFGLEPPFFCDYGYNIQIGDQVFFNFNCVILDVTPVTIGDRCLFGPGVHIYAATHPVNAEVRGSLQEFGKPVHIENDVWVGGGAIVCPGVTIGARSIIAAGAVVTKDIPADVLAGGNPARIIKSIDERPKET